MNLTGLSSRVAAEVKSSYAAASRFGAEVSDRAHTAFVAAMHVALLTGAGAALLAALATLILLARRRQGASPDEHETADAARRPSTDILPTPRAAHRANLAEHHAHRYTPQREIELAHVRQALSRSRPRATPRA